MKQRMSYMKSGENTGNVKGGEQTGTSGGMNTSFSAMNSSLSQKWISKKTQISNGREGSIQGLAQQQMSSTMAVGFGGAPI